MDNTTYNADKYISDIIFVNISDIYFDQVMLKTCESYNIDINNINIISYYDYNIVGRVLTRIEHVISGVNDNTLLPPIKLFKCIQGKYKIIDGRHRVVASLIKGYKYIPATIKSMECGIRLSKSEIDALNN